MIVRAQTRFPRASAVGNARSRWRSRELGGSHQQRTAEGAEAVEVEMFDTIMPFVAGTILAAIFGYIAYIAVCRQLRIREWRPPINVLADVCAIRPGCVLIIVDMQWHFLRTIPRRARKLAVAAIVREIEAARAINAPIVILEFADCGDTINKIRRALAGYELRCTMQKSAESGVREVMETCRQCQFPMTMFRLVGVNTDACVYQTAAELGMRASVEVVVDACLTDSIGYDWCEYVEYQAGRAIDLVRNRVLDPAEAAANPPLPREKLGYAYNCLQPAKSAGNS
jgi:hypothetical protein